jgi:hypothetical protein
MAKISKNAENDIPNHPFHSNKKSKNNKNNVGCDPTKMNEGCRTWMSGAKTL